MIRPSTSNPHGLPEQTFTAADLARAYEAGRDDAAEAAEKTGTCLLPSGHFLSERCRDAIRALPVPSPADLAKRLGGAE